MQLLRFELRGKFAHFRKYYANNTAMSYFLPPRTALMGMMASILGLEKDQYYESLSTDHFRIGAGILTPLKKSFHRLNLLMIKSSGDFRGRQGRVQTPFEVVSAYDINKDQVAYVVYLSTHTGGKEMFQSLVQHILYRTSIYNLSLGTANFSGQITNPVLLNEGVEEKEAQSQRIDFSSAVNADFVEELNWEQGRDMLLEEELSPLDFVANEDRELKSLMRILYSTDGRKLPITYTGKYTEILYKGNIERIAFME